MIYYIITFLVYFSHSVYNPAKTVLHFYPQAFFTTHSLAMSAKKHNCVVKWEKALDVPILCFCLLLILTIFIYLLLLQNILYNP